MESLEIPGTLTLPTDRSEQDTHKIFLRWHITFKYHTGEH